VKAAPNQGSETANTPLPDETAVEFSDNGTVAANATQSAEDALKAELARIETQLNDLRAKIARLHSAGLSGEKLNLGEAKATRSVAANRRKWPSNVATAESEPNQPDMNPIPRATRTAAQGDAFVDKQAAPRQPIADKGHAGIHFDVVRLAEAYADAVGGLDVARARLEQAIATANEGNATTAARAEVKVQEITVRSAERKLLSLRRIAQLVTGAAEVELKSCEEEIQWQKNLFEKGYISEGQVRSAARQYQSADANLKTLRSILAE
jgi:hypothetical protein